jgi:hypothetical protein
VGERLGPLRHLLRWLVQLVARYIVVSYLRQVSTDMRNLYWLRELQLPLDAPEREMLGRARLQAEGLREIFRRRTVGGPSFVLGGLLVPVVVSLARLADGFAFSSWWIAAIVGLVGALVAVGISRHTLREPLRTLWTTIGGCRAPARDQSRSFAVAAITATLGAWIVLPTLVGVALATR